MSGYKDLDNVDNKQKLLEYLINCTDEQFTAFYERAMLRLGNFDERARLQLSNFDLEQMARGKKTIARKK